MYRQELDLRSPWMNAAGTLGFAPPPRWPGPEALGAFVTNPVSQGLRSPAANRGALRFTGGVLLHSGLPNPGLSRVLRRYGERWAQSDLPVWVHLIAQHPEEIRQMVRRLEGQEGVAAVELGLPPDVLADDALAMVSAGYGELPLVVYLPLTAAGEPWLSRLPEMGASAITLGAPRGALPAGDGRIMSGRVFGPACFPLMLDALLRVRRLGIPVIAGAGVYHRQDAQALLDAGARAVQIDTALWRGWGA